MWQRPQTLYMALSMILSIALTVVSVGYFEVQGNLINVSGLGVENMESLVTPPSTLPLLVVIVVSILSIAFAITQFKNRTLQFKVLSIALFIQPLLIGVAYFVLNQCFELLVAIDESTAIGFGLGFVFPVVNTILLFLARTGVKKDEDLVKSVDRLR